MSTNVPVQSDAASTEPDDAVRVRRAAHRAAYDAAAINAILDDGFVAHVATVRDGAPVIIPMYYVRDGDHVLIHGAPAAGVLRRGQGTEVCLSVTHLDGMVLARSAFHHSMNYRSVVVVGTAELVTDPTDKAAALELFVERMIPGRQADLRPNTKKEIQGTSVLRLSLATASAKVRDGGPIDDDEDYELPIWAGVVPMGTSYGAIVDDERNLDGVAVPANVAAFGH